MHSGHFSFVREVGPQMRGGDPGGISKVQCGAGKRQPLSLERDKDRADSQRRGSRAWPTPGDKTSEHISTQTSRSQTGFPWFLNAKEVELPLRPQCTPSEVVCFGISV